SRRSDPPDQRLRPSTCLRAWSMRYCLRAWSKSSECSVIGVSLGFRGGLGALMQPRLDLLRRPVVLPPAPAVITTQLGPRLCRQRLVTTDRREQRLLRVTDLPPRRNRGTLVGLLIRVRLMRRDRQRLQQERAVRHAERLRGALVARVHRLAN